MGSIQNSKQLEELLKYAGETAGPQGSVTAERFLLAAIDIAAGSTAIDISRGIRLTVQKLLQMYVVPDCDWDKARKLIRLIIESRKRFDKADAVSFQKCLQKAREKAEEIGCSELPMVYFLKFLLVWTGSYFRPDIETEDLSGSGVAVQDVHVSPKPTFKSEEAESDVFIIRKDPSKKQKKAVIDTPIKKQTDKFVTTAGQETVGTEEKAAPEKQEVPDEETEKTESTVMTTTYKRRSNRDPHKQSREDGLKEKRGTPRTRYLNLLKRSKTCTIIYRVRYWVRRTLSALSPPVSFNLN